jgi:glycerol-3-phosphate acyltransferase PlsY
MSPFAIPLVVLGYLMGSIPTAYLAGRWLKGVDLRQHGSGTVSGSMVWEHVARWAILPVGIFDLAKGAFPAWLALEMGQGTAVSTAAGLAAVAGHNWPIFFGFTGGRGLSPFLGLLLVVFPWGFPWMLVFLAVGWRLGDSAPWALAALVTLPVFAQVMGGPGMVVTLASAGMLLLTLAKRLEANGRPLPATAPERKRVILRRLFLDRDIASHSEWIRRRPDEPTSRQSEMG